MTYVDNSFNIFKLPMMTTYGQNMSEYALWINTDFIDNTCVFSCLFIFALW
jgi:hypothetical protein